jgi:Superinfection immunity protein
MHLAAMLFLPFFGFGLALYFLPSIIALARNKRDTLAIFLLNFFLGWTFIVLDCLSGLGGESGRARCDRSLVSPLEDPAYVQQMRAAGRCYAAFCPSALASG